MKTLLIIMIFALSSPVLAGVSVIVHPSNSAALESNEVSRIFLGKMKSFPGGGAVVPINLAEGSAPRKSFEKAALKKSSSQIKAYWSKLVFTGKGTPPKEVTSEAEMINLVKANPNIIGYVSSEAVTADVKVVATF